ncbi:hypothetical protein DPMN_019787 [Dreissena polymorpha]|uniref:Uncharacterized protein n=1 Tax=Dreissena polymorpha TaxID=45954 RepID=A0A9D4SAI3_DREPO|nr:hypothetical protein DPMN_019787 [Dreissena polymorpha]
MPCVIRCINGAHVKIISPRTGNNKSTNKKQNTFELSSDIHARRPDLGGTTICPDIRKKRLEMLTQAMLCRIHLLIILQDNKVLTKFRNSLRILQSDHNNFECL